MEDQERRNAVQAPQPQTIAWFEVSRPKYRLRAFSIDSNKTLAASTLGGFPTRAEVAQSQNSRRAPHQKSFTNSDI
ncbi:hypothetical protein [Aliiruegeria lutimaris]|uniref:hypothetical protein n=1 Tax=Aliiruegeria lutimaris TaxID=571298 RepID=UPI001113C803|nr:hypothetical protein [Aliiruegeria lutimaris]